MSDKDRSSGSRQDNLASQTHTPVYSPPMKLSCGELNQIPMESVDYLAEQLLKDLVSLDNLVCGTKTRNPQSLLNLTLKLHLSLMRLFLTHSLVGGQLYRRLSTLDDILSALRTIRGIMRKLEED